MTRRSFLGITILGAVAVSLVALQATPSDRISDAVQARMARDGVPGVVVVVLKNGASFWTRSFGQADPATGRAMTADALFRVESISKPVTAWGAMRLAKTGRIDLDAPTTDCLTHWQPPEGTPPLTPRQLLSHTAGIGLGDFAERYAPDAQRPGLAEHVAEDFEILAPAPAAFSYSDTGFNLLELVMEYCTGEDFAAFMSREVLGPLGMEHAGFDWPGVEMPVGHDLHGRQVAPYVYPGRASGGLFATADDIARFAAAAMDGADQDVLSPGGVAELHFPAVAVGGLFGFAAESYGLGHFTETLSDGHAAVWHGGQGYGWMSHLHLVPETGDGIVILSNSQRAWPLFADVLRVWSESLGVQPVGMTRVLWVETAARFAIAGLGIVAALALWVAVTGASRNRAVRVIAGAASVAFIVWPLWATGQDYLFLFSILPGLWPWLAAASGIAGLCLAALALGPKRRRSHSMRT
jgi:CubicO group peptidase (beta-lactamase class C family)